MMELPRSQNKLPAGITLEKPAKNLASLATTSTIDAMAQIVVRQWSHTAEFARLAKHGIRPIDRLLFYGPPGNGKTMAAQWVAGKIDAPLYRVRSESLISSALGGTARILSEVMNWLAGQGKSVVLVDEVEQLFRSRTEAKDSCDRELTSVMAIFWQFLDRWEAPTLFILATNLPDELDAALLSRIDVKLEFGPPTPEQVDSVIRYWQEVLHEFGSDQWGPQLLERTNYKSFRALFQEIQHCVRQHVTG
jgi:ATP-dependent 26S proteasome regulatory subunit